MKRFLKEPLSARERARLEQLCADIEALAEEVPTLAWFLTSWAKLLRDLLEGLA